MPHLRVRGMMGGMMRLRILNFLASCALSFGWCAHCWHDLVDRSPAMNTPYLTNMYASDRASLVLWAVGRVLVAVVTIELLGLSGWIKAEK